MRRMFLLSALFVGSVFAAGGAAQAAGSCEAMLENFDAQLSAKGIPTTDERVAQARSQAQESCATGNLTAAQSSLNRAEANVGLPQTFGSVTGGDTGATEAGGSQSQAGQSGASTQSGENTQNGNASQNAGTNGTQNSGNNNSGSNQSASGNSGNQNGTTNGGTGSGQTANASSGDQNSNGSGANNNGSGSKSNSGGSQSGTQ